MSVKLLVWNVVAAGCGALALVLPAGADASKAGKAKPDLTVAAVSVSGSGGGGSTLTATATVRATKAAAPVSRTSFYISTDTTRSANDVLVATSATRALKPSAKQTSVVVKLVLPARTNSAYYVIACADGVRRIAEVSEKNNCRPSARRSAPKGSTGGGGTPSGGTSSGTTQGPNQDLTTNSDPNANPPAPPALPVLRMDAARSSVEGDIGTIRTLEFDVALSAAATTAVTFTWATSSVTSAGPGDFVASGGDATIPVGQTSATLAVPIVGDTDAEDDEDVRVVLTSASGATLGMPSRGDASILDDDPASARVDRSASTQTSIAIAFSSAPTNLATNGAQFTIAGLPVSAASLTGKVVTLTTAPQLANQEYTVELDASLRSGHRTLPATVDVVGLGPVAQLEITEVNPNIAGNADRVELRALTSGSLVGAAVDTAPFGGNGAYVALPSIEVASGDLIVIHYGSPGTFTSEMSNRAQCSTTPCIATAWDVAENTSLTITPKVLAVVDGNGHVTDGVAFRQTADSTVDAALLHNLARLQDAGLWRLCGIAHCTTSGDYDSVAANWTGTATSAAGNSIRRIGPDTNEASNWEIGPSSWGAANG